MIRIKSKKKAGFWRAGVKHGPEWTEHADDRFTPEQIKKLQAEKNLVVEVCDAVEAKRDLIGAIENATGINDDVTDEIFDKPAPEEKPEKTTRKKGGK